MRGGIQSQVTDFQHRRTRAGSAAQESPQPGDQNRVRKRLGQIVVGAVVEPLNLVDDPVFRGENQDGRPIALAAQCPAHVVAVRAGQHDVENDRVKGNLPRHPDSVRAVVNDVDGKTLRLEPLAKSRGKPLFVLDDK